MTLSINWTLGRCILMPDFGSEMDVIRIEPVERLVDAAALEPSDGDASVHITDQASFRRSSRSDTRDQYTVLSASHSVIYTL